MSDHAEHRRAAATRLLDALAEADRPPPPDPLLPLAVIAGLAFGAVMVWLSS